MSYADVFGGQGSPQWVTLATGVGGKSRPVPARSMSGYRFRNMSGCVVQLVVDGTLQDEFEPYSEGSGYLGYPGQSIQQVQYLVQEGDPVELSNYAVSSWRCLVELVPVDLPYQRVRMSATITGTVQLAAGSIVGLTGGTSVGVSGSVPVINVAGGTLSAAAPSVSLGTITWNGPISTPTTVATVNMDPHATALAITMPQWGIPFGVRILGHQTGTTFWSGSCASGSVNIAPLFYGFDTQFDFQITSDTGVGGHYIFGSVMSDAIVTIPQNYGNGPLIVQPASGSQQTVVPGTAAASSISSASNGVESAWSSIASAIAKPSSIYGCTAGAQGETAPTVAGTNWATMINVIARGSTSLKRLYLATFGIVSASTATGGNDVWAAGGTGPPAIFPYPISGAVYWPSDSTIDLGYTTIGVIPRILGVQANLITA